jgi:Flp pilus assembly protein TadD
MKGVCLDELGRSDEAQIAYGKSLELEIILDMHAEQKRMRRQ